MKNWIIRVLISSVAVIITSYLLKGVKNVGFIDAIVVAVVLSFLNSFLKPILVVLTIPVTVITLGLFLLVINAGIIMAADSILDNFHVESFGWALLFSLILSFVNAILEGIFGPSDN